MGYGLLTLPAMPERKKLGRLFKGFYPDISTHEMSTIAYRYAESGLSSWHVSSKIFLTYFLVFRDHSKEMRRQLAARQDGNRPMHSAISRGPKHISHISHHDVKLTSKKAKRQRHDDDIGDILSEYKEMRKEMKLKR